MTLCAALGACAVGGMGTLAAQVQQRDALSVLTVHSIGLHLRTREDDRGAHLGYSARTYAFGGDAALEPGWYFLSVPSPGRSAIAQDLMTFGMEVSTVNPLAGFTLGYAHNRLHARVPGDASLLIEYRGSNLRIDKLQICQENIECVMPSLPR